MLGELVPEGGGDNIPLVKEHLMVGRRESCDVVLRFSNVSTHHCELMLEKGYWFVKDLGSRNGTKVNGLRVTKKKLDPGDRLTIARHDYRVTYSPEEIGAEGPPPDEDVMAEIMSQSLLDGAGLNRKQKQILDGRIGRGAASQAQSPPSTEPESAAGDEQDVSGSNPEPATEEDPGTPEQA